MKRGAWAVTGALIGLFIVAVVPAFAHHSFAAEFNVDDTKMLSVTGVLTKVDWVNPHIYFYVDAKDENGKTVTWAFENFPPSWWRKYGLPKDILKVGEVVTVDAYSAKDGTKHLGYGKVIHFADGRTVDTLAGGDARDIK